MAENDASPPLPKITPTYLASIPLFEGLSKGTLDSMAANLPVKRIAPGDLIVAAGDTSKQMFVVMAGELEVFVQSHGNGDVRVAMFGPNDWFGEMSLIDVQPRSANVRALAPTLLIVVTADHVDALMRSRNLDDYALLITNIARELSRRLRVADGILSHFYASMTHQYVAGGAPRAG